MTKMKQKESKRRLIMFMMSIVLMISMLLGSGSQYAAAATKSVRVRANVEWVRTGIFVKEGQTIRLVTRGKAVTGPLNIYPGAISGPEGQLDALGCGQYEEAPPPCALDGAPYGALIGRVGPFGEPFLIGGASSFIAPATGKLYLVVNDNLGTYSDNRRGYTVLIRGK
jgi:hypothetical protein